MFGFCSSKWRYCEGRDLVQSTLSWSVCTTALHHLASSHIKHRTEVSIGEMVRKFLSSSCCCKQRNYLKTTETHTARRERTWDNKWISKCKLNQDTWTWSNDKLGSWDNCLGCEAGRVFCIVFCSGGNIWSLLTIFTLLITDLLSGRRLFCHLLIDSQHPVLHPAQEMVQRDASGRGCKSSERPGGEWVGCEEDGGSRQNNIRSVFPITKTKGHQAENFSLGQK